MRAKSSTTLVRLLLSTPVWLAINIFQLFAQYFIFERILRELCIPDLFLLQIRFDLELNLTENALVILVLLVNLPLLQIQEVQEAVPHKVVELGVQVFVFFLLCFNFPIDFFQECIFVVYQEIGSIHDDALLPHEYLYLESSIEPIDPDLRLLFSRHLIQFHRDQFQIVM